MSWDVLYRIGLRFKQLEEWPDGAKPSSARASFKEHLKETTELLAHELNELNSRKSVIELAIPQSDFYLRLDGLPRSTARASYPGVILSLDTKYGPLKIHSNRFADWKDNLHAIVLHLEHLRQAGRYGVGKNGEQYFGWYDFTDYERSRQTKRKAGKKKEQTKSSPSGLEQAVAFLSEYSGVNVTRENVKAAYRKCALRLHPDATTGSHDLFIALQKAREVAFGHWHLKI